MAPRSHCTSPGPLVCAQAYSKRAPPVTVTWPPLPAPPLDRSRGSALRAGPSFGLLQSHKISQWAFNLRDPSAVPAPTLKIPFGSIFLGQLVSSQVGYPVLSGEADDFGHQALSSECRRHPDRDSFSWRRPPPFGDASRQGEVLRVQDGGAL